MDNALAGIVSDAQNSTENAPLCSYYAQVIKSKYNPHYVRELCKENVVDWLFLNGYQDLSDKVNNCGTAFIHLEDTKGHEKYNRLRCKNEFCPVCGAKNSPLHLRRVSRASFRLLWNGLLGYFVFTLPREVSESRPDKEIIEKLIKEAWEIVKKNFTTPGGLSRIHLIGEGPGKLHIHINFLFPLLNEANRGMIDKTKITLIRDEWTKVLNAMFNLNIKESNFHYRFADKIGKKIHKIKYVLRPIVTAARFLTLSDEDRHYVLNFKGWHNTRWHGELSNSKYKKYLKDRGIDIEKMETEIDGLLSPAGEKYHFVGIVQEKDLPKNKLKWLDNDTLVDYATFEYLRAQSP